MSRRYLLYLKDMHEACTKVQEFALPITFKEFVTCGMPYHAIVRLIEVIGEAAKNIPKEVRKRHPDVEWRKMSRTRDILAHHYFSLEDETLWEIVQKHVPELLDQLEVILNEEFRQDHEDS